MGSAGVCPDWGLVMPEEIDLWFPGIFVSLFKGMLCADHGEAALLAAPARAACALWDGNLPTRTHTIRQHHSSG